MCALRVGGGLDSSWNVVRLLKCYGYLLDRYSCCLCRRHCYYSLVVLNRVKGLHNHVLMRGIFDLGG